MRYRYSCVLSYKGSFKKKLFIFVKICRIYFLWLFLNVLASACLENFEIRFRPFRRKKLQSQYGKFPILSKTFPAALKLINDLKKPDPVCFIYPELGTKKYGSTEHVEERREEGKEEEQERQKWGSPVEFLLSCIAMSVRLRNYLSQFSQVFLFIKSIHTPA